LRAHLRYAVAVACAMLGILPHVAMAQSLTAPGPPALTQKAVETGEYKGLSDLTVDSSGHFWSAPERQRAILRLDLAGPHPRVDAAPIPLDGVPLGTDTESVVWLSDNHFAMGTETQQDKRESDDILLVTVADGRAKVTQKIPMPYRLWDVRANTNEGLEGICAAKGQLLATSESVALTHDNKRYAPLGRYDMANQTWTPFKLLLTSRIGRISALGCRADKNAQVIEVVALERYIGVSHVLRFRIPISGDGTTIVPDVLVDLGKAMDSVPNIEGVAWSPQGDLDIISDNDYGVITGPTQLITIPRDWH
jgi:hypothetical protein